jgi:dTDP-glucose 4,6-dehydratase
MSRKKILLTGSLGFICSNFIRKAAYNKLDYQFVSIDKALLPNSLNNIYYNKSHTFYLGDFSDQHFVDTVFKIERPDYVIHMGAESFVDDSLKTPNAFIISNVLGTQVIVNSCIKYGVEKLVYCSTDESYGQLKSASEASWTEESPTKPRNPYSASKLAGELVVQAAGETHNLNYNITRSCNNFGPRQPVRNLIPRIIHNIHNNLPVPIYGKGEQIREWIHVDDHCSAMMEVLEKGKNKEIYNVSSGYEFSNIEIFNEVCNIMGKGFDLLTFVEDRKGHDFRYSCNSDKLRGLGWSPKVKFKSGLTQTVEWYLNNSWFMR